VPLDSLYVIGIGGTGAKCIEAIVEAASVGLFTEQPLRLLFVDADETNGNLERARGRINLYQNCYNLMQGEKHTCPWMKTPIEAYGLWSPFEETSTNKDLGSFFQYNNLKQTSGSLGHLFDVLYTADERQVPLDVGFRGRPAIGAAIMSQVKLEKLDREPWGSLIKQLKSDVAGGKTPGIFLCGSIFGGTGASGLPTIGRLIANKLSEENIRDGVRISCLFVLPYFGFAPPKGEDPDGVYARSEQFLLNTEAALRYYTEQAKQTFDTVYLLGNQKFTKVNFSIGKKTQRNEPHFLEFYGALAARLFLSEPPPGDGSVVLMSRKDLGRLGWNDLPDAFEVKTKLLNATRFAYVWLSNIGPELQAAKSVGIDRFQKQAPWFPKFYRPTPGLLGKIFDKKGEELPDFNDADQQKAVEIITDWCKDYLDWLYDIHQCEGEQIDLFRADLFAKPIGDLPSENLARLAIEDSRDRGRQERDTVQELRNRLDPERVSPPNQGTAGLAKALYQLCQL